MNFRICLLNFLLLFSCISMSASTFDVIYDIYGAGEAKSGYYLVEINAYVQKKKEINKEITKRCALHGVLFKGYPASKGNASKPALIKDNALESEKEAYFKTLIEENFDNYTSMANDFMKVVKEGKQYRITTFVLVNVSKLRKDLEKENIIRTLGF